MRGGNISIDFCSRRCRARTRTRQRRLQVDDPAIDEDKLIKDAADERADIATMDRRVRQLTGSRTRIRKARDTPANVDGRH